MQKLSMAIPFLIIVATAAVSAVEFGEQRAAPTGHLFLGGKSPLNLPGGGTDVETEETQKPVSKNGTVNSIANVAEMKMQGDQTASNNVADAAPDSASDDQDQMDMQESSVPDAVSNSTSLSSEELKMTSAEMEAAITNLMLGKSAFGATPMGDSVKKIKKIITGTMMVKVKSAHKSDQSMLNALVKAIYKCGSLKQASTRAADLQLAKYKSNSRLHKKCRSVEAVRYASKVNCLRDQAAKHSLKVLKCKLFSDVSRKWGSTKNNVDIVKKAGSESVESYIRRLSITYCGKHNHGPKGELLRRGGMGGGLAGGALDQYLRAKDACRKATSNWNAKVKECNRMVSEYKAKKSKCNHYQDFMDGASCKGAVLAKDACESYAGCYFSKVKAYRIAERKVRFDEIDRKAEWRGLQRMLCLMGAFADGKVTNKEVDACKKKSHSTKYFNIVYPKVPKLTKCVVPKLYPSTSAYKRAEFAPLPAFAKGKESHECSGVNEISLTPYAGSPKACKCHRVVINGHYSAGALVKCTNGRTVRRANEQSSCPRGTKIFAPATRADWKSFLDSAKPLRAPHWIIDVTRPQNGCGGCTRSPMNSRNSRQKSWRTTDGAPWWLRSKRYNEPNGDYTANCFLDLWKPPQNENSITFNDHRCNYHSKSYYCQPTKLDLKPRAGSPASCRCNTIVLATRYAPGDLVKCSKCLTVYRSQQKNSCPLGMKIFSPRTRADWKTFLNSAGPLRDPHWIIDVTRPQNGCGGCTRFPMRKSTPQQASWRTSDASPWWLRSSRYNEPNGDYTANCFLDLWRTPNTENNIQFNDHRCNYRSRSYYCQPAQSAQSITTKSPPKTPSPRILVGQNKLKTGLLMKAFYFGQGSHIPNMNGRRPNLIQRVNTVNYGNTGGAWPGFSHRDNFAVRWDGLLNLRKSGRIDFLLNSDDGSKLYIEGRTVVNNDGLHSWRQKQGSYSFGRRGQYRLLLTFFERGGHAGMRFRWNYGGRFSVVPSWALQCQEPGGWKEQQYFFGSNRRVPNLNGMRPAMTRTVPRIQYHNTGGNWPGFGRRDRFGARWTGRLTIQRGGTYRFMTGSDDGSKVFIDRRYVVNNDGLHGWRTRYANVRVSSGKRYVEVQFFENGGHAGCIFYYQGTDTGNRMIVVPPQPMEAAV